MAERLTNIFFKEEFRRPFLLAKYGALAGLLAIGPDYVRDTVLPKLKFVVEQLNERLKSDNGKHSNAIERSEVIRLKAFLMRSCQVIWMKCLKTNYKLDKEIVDNIVFYFGSSIFEPI